MAENSTPAAKKKPRGKPFQKGVSGNPGGRPKGLASLIQERTSDGVEVVEFFLKVFRGQLTVLGSDGDIAPSIKERMEAGKWLADRAWGLPAQPVTGEDGGPVAVRVVKYGEGD